jgi:hypothetical protein
MAGNSSENVMVMLRNYGKHIAIALVILIVVILFVVPKKPRDKDDKKKNK